MKITKIPGLGRFGIFVDDLDFNTMTDEQWLELGQLHLDSLVTIIRNVKLQPNEYEAWVRKWGDPRALVEYRMRVKYKTKQLANIYNQTEFNGVKVDDEDQQWIQTIVGMMPEYNETSMLRVSGRKDNKGNPLGMFAEGELLWHSNESGNLCFSPAVALYGQSGVVGSATGFVTTPDWYEEQSNAFRSELDEMILLHKFTPGRINPGLREDHDFMMYKNMCPEPSELPLVLDSPKGIRGIHYSINTIDSIKGMSQEESRKVFDYIDKTLFVDRYTYDHWYQQDNDICFFDNSVTLHRRLGGIADRLCYRIQYEYNKLVPSPAPRYILEPFKTQYYEDSLKINEVLDIK
jgi:alpha-ketoglutarate-dependent taurine dioxygenase